MSASQKTVHRLKISLDGIRPPVWRRVLVPSRASVADLHQVIQEAFGWYDCHLHEFEIDGARYGRADGDADWDPPQDERQARLDDVAPKGSRFAYVYDFGDDWVHRIEIEDIVAAEPAQAYPECLAGRRAGPPEDVGGPWGYADFLQAINDPSHESHAEMLEWVGGDFDPDAFDLATINASLSPINP